MIIMKDIIIMAFKNGVVCMKKLNKKEINDLYEAGPEAVGNVINTLIDYINEQKESIISQQRIISAQQKQINQLKERVKKLEEQINKNSKNSSKPPSTDGFNKIKSLRKKGLKRNGGQKGHKGHTLHQVDNPDKIVTHHATTCKLCDFSLNNANPVNHEKRQVIDIEVRQVVTEHQVEKTICPRCGTHNKGVFPEDVKSPVQYGSEVSALATYLNYYQLLPYERICDLFEDIFGIRPSEATLINANTSIYNKLEVVEDRIKELIARSSVVHFDETGLSVKGKTNWLHSASTDNLTYYALHKKRGQIAMNDIGLLPEYQGVAVHDFWKSYLTYSNCQHSLCNAHLLRELTGIYENDQKQKWAQEMIHLLCEIKDAVDDTKENTDKTSLTPLQISFFQGVYQQVLDRGFMLNEKLDKEKAPEEPSKKRGRKKQSKAKNLLDRFEKNADDILRFMVDFNVPFDNNLAERDLRMVKVKEKISGTFRSEQGANMFARIRGYISTVRKNNKSVIKAIKDAFTGNPDLPEILDTS